jgi:uncharacterized 2Fe-2S/4Fe-4S cluster protein (DUF4445 family)
MTAELLRVGIISPEGRILDKDELPENLPESITRRVQNDQKGQNIFVLSELNGGTNRKTVAITQRDIRELQLGCGAIRAGISILLRKTTLTAKDLKTVLVAGGFGGFIRRDKAQRIGLIPSDINHRKIRYVGNVSLAGARWGLLSLDARRHCEELARRTHHVELAVDGDFQTEFAEAMVFPES